MINEKYLSIEIDGVDYSEYMTFPFTVQNTRTDQLNTAMVNLVGTKQKAAFKPFSLVSMSGGKFHYFIANDTVTEVFGRNRWNHELTLIDTTKLSERVLMEAKAFTQPIARDTTVKPQRPLYSFYVASVAKEATEKVGAGSYLSPFDLDDTRTINIYSVNEAFPNIADLVKVGERIKVSIYFNKFLPVTHSTVDSYEPIYTTSFASTSESEDYTIPSQYGIGIYTIVYNIPVATEDNLGWFSWIAYVPIAATRKSEVLEPYSLYDVLQILFEIETPIFSEREQRYHLNVTEEQMEILKATRAPEFRFSNGRSMLENLREIGSVVHWIPRVDKDYNVSFKELGSSKYADLSKIDRFSYTDTHNAGEYASTIEANFANLVNAEDEILGSVTEPYTDGYVSFRSSDGSYRIADETSNIHTYFSIAKALKLEVTTPKGTADLTKYLYEKAEYDQLSSFAGVFPFSKTYALYYTKGGKSIDGFWFRSADQEATDWADAFKYYSITNILNDVFGESLTNKDWGFDSIAFRVTYIPFMNGRTRQAKTEYFGSNQLVLAHNQSANELSANAFGENLRGQIAKIGNASKSFGALHKDLSDAPEAGLLYDENNYISTVTTRVFPGYCASQIDLSENYNELGAYGEIKTGIRQYSIPAGQDRQTLMEEYCLIGKMFTDDEGTGTALATLCQERLKTMTIESFSSSGKAMDISSVGIKTTTETGKTIAEYIYLPVYSTALGTSVYLGFSFADNFSAGERSISVAEKKYRGTEHIGYGDAFYARAKRLTFSFYNTYKHGEDVSDLTIANMLPQTTSFYDTVDTGGETDALIHGSGLRWNKDGGDACSVAYQLHFITNDGWIITSELARMMKYVQSAKGYDYTTDPRMYFYKSRVNRLTGEVNEDDLVGSIELIPEFADDSFYGEHYYLRLIEPLDPGAYQSVVIKRPGGKCILAKNTSDINEGVTSEFEKNRIFFNFLHRR